MIRDLFVVNRDQKKTRFTTKRSRIVIFFFVRNGPSNSRSRAFRSSIFMQEKVPTSTNVQSVRIELTKLIFVGTRVTYQATGDVRTCRHPAHPVSALLLHPREIQALWSQNYDTGSIRCTYQVDSSTVVQCDAVRCARYVLIDVPFLWYWRLHSIICTLVFFCGLHPFVRQYAII